MLIAILFIFREW